MAMYNAIRRSALASIDLASPLRVSSLTLADSFKVPSALFDSMKGLGLAPQLSAVSKLLADVNVLPGRLFGLTALSESVFSSIRADTLGVKLGLDAHTRTLLTDGLGAFSNTYRAYLTEATKPDADTLPREFIHLPAVEVLNQAELSAVTSETDPADGLDEARAVVEPAAQAETEDSLIQLVAKFDPKLLDPIRGAREALQRRGPDYMRHAAASFREVFNYTLHGLAPDDKVAAWSTSKTDYDKGKLTRAARVRYICREVNPTFGGFLTPNVELVTGFVDEFNRATHVVGITLAHEQVETMRVRMEGLIRLLLLAGLGRLR
jgi:hypothetical protein